MWPHLSRSFLEKHDRIPSFRGSPAATLSSPHTVTHNGVAYRILGGSLHPMEKLGNKQIPRKMQCICVEDHIDIRQCNDWHEVFWSSQCMLYITMVTSMQYNRLSKSIRMKVNQLYMMYMCQALSKSHPALSRQLHSLKKSKGVSFSWPCQLMN